MPEEYPLVHEHVFHEGVFHEGSLKFAYSTTYAHGNKKYDYTVYLDSCWQLNETRGTWRRIRRVGGGVTSGEPWTQRGKY